MNINNAFEDQSESLIVEVVRAYITDRYVGYFFEEISRRSELCIIKSCFRSYQFFLRHYSIENVQLEVLIKQIEQDIEAYELSRGKYANADRVGYKRIRKRQISKVHGLDK